MDFDTHLAQIQGCLSHAKRVVGPLDQLTLENDLDAVQVVLDKVEGCIAGFSEKELNQAHLFLLLNSNPGWNDECLQYSELGHLIGIAPIISVDVFLALSVELISLQNFIFDAISFLPYSLAYEITNSYITLYFKNGFQKVAQKLDLLCLAIYYNVVTSKCEKDFQNFWNLLETVLTSIHNAESKADSFTCTCLFKAVLSLLKSCLKKEIPFDAQKWKDFYTRPTTESDAYISNNIDMFRNMIIEHVGKICSNIPVRSMSATCETFLSIFEPVGELAYECVTELRGLYPTCDALLNDLMSIARKPHDVSDEIKESSLSSLCCNSLIENDNQHLWLKALIYHDNGLSNEEALNTLNKFVDLFDSDDDKFVCDMFHNFPEIKTVGSRDLAVKCFSRLSMEDKYDMLKCRVASYGSENFFFNENCEFDILEVLNRLVAQGDKDCQEDQLMVLAYKSPELVVKHVLRTAAVNKLFSTSVVLRILQSLQAVFACPANTSPQVTNLTDVILADSIFNTDEINKEYEGLQHLVKLLLKENLINEEYFLRFSVFPPLFISIIERQDNTAILLLQILLDFQAEVTHWERKVNISTVLVFLGQVLERLSRGANMEESQGSIIREIAIRNIDKVFSLPNWLQSVQDADTEWMLNELSVLSPANRHLFSHVVPEWMLFHGDTGSLRSQAVVSLATVLPDLHVSEWHQLLKVLSPSCEEDLLQNFEKALTFCSAVKLIARAAMNRKSVMVYLNLKSLIRNLGSVIQSCLKSGIAPCQLPRILKELLSLLEYFPKSEQFDVAVFILPILFDIVDQGCRDGDRSTLTAFGKLVLDTSVPCVRRDLGRHLKKVLIGIVNRY